MSDLKQQLYLMCRKYIAQRVASLNETLAETRDAANDESKSSAGDKYETSREMMQQDMDVSIIQLNELQKLQVALDLINPGVKSDIVKPGSLVITNLGAYYLSISAGQLKFNEAVYYAVSPSSPIGNLLLGQKAGYGFVLNNKSYQIKEVI